MKILAISGSLRQGSHNTDLLRGAAAAAPDGVDIELYHGLKDIPPYDADEDQKVTEVFSSVPWTRIRNAPKED